MLHTIRILPDIANVFYQFPPHLTNIFCHILPVMLSLHRRNGCIMLDERARMRLPSPKFRETSEFVVIFRKSITLPFRKWIPLPLTRVVIHRDIHHNSSIKARISTIDVPISTTAHQYHQNIHHYPVIIHHSSSISAKISIFNLSCRVENVIFVFILGVKIV